MSAPEKEKSFMGEFKTFIARGNVMDMAVGVIIGGAFGKISTSLVNDVIMPLISVLTGGVDFSNWKIVLKAAVAGADGVIDPATEVAIKYGSFLATILDFLIIAFIINYACYFSVIYRGGIEGVPAGQREAGEVLGLTKRQIFFKITLLQMVKRIIPPMSNEIITLVKDTSLARTIAIIEITMAGEAFMKSKGITWPLFYTGVFYLAFVGLLTLLFSFIERKLSYFK